MLSRTPSRSGSRPHRMLGALLALSLAALPAASPADREGEPRLRLPADPRLATPFETAASTCDDGGVLLPSCTDRTSEGSTPQPGPATTSSSDPGPGLVETRTAVTPTWWAQLAPRADGSLVRVHGFGHVGVLDADGEDLWARSYVSLLDEWGLTQSEPRVAVIPVGWSNVPGIVASERPFAVADLTGDGIEDVAVSYLVTTVVQPLDRVTIVSILDGVDGALRWHAAFPGYVSQVIAEDDTLVLGVESGPQRPGAPGDGAPGTTSRLVGYRFEPGVPLVGSEAWSWETGDAWLRWLTAEPVGDTIALGSAPSTGGSGELTVVHAATGEIRWSRQLAGLPRVVRHDVGRDRIAVVEQADPATADAYEVALLDTTAGDDLARLTRPGAIPIRSVLADVDSDGGLDVVVSDIGHAAIDHAWTDQGRVVALDGDDLSLLWENIRDETTDGFIPVPFGLAAAGSDVAVVWFIDDNQYLVAELASEIGVIDGSTGAVRWTERSPTYPFFVTTHAGRVFTGTFEQALHGREATDGERTFDVPVFTHVHALEVLDVDGDGRDELLAGTESGGVFALDAQAIDDDPAWRWRTNLGSAVHQLQLADVTVDAGDEIVAAASGGIYVLRSDGSVIGSFSEGEYTWTATAADLDGDGLDDLLIPTRWLTAWSPAQGRTLWTFPDAGGVPETYFSTPVVTSDGVVGAQVVHHTTGRRSLTTRLPNGDATSVRQVALLDAATGESSAIHQPIPADWTTFLWRSAALLESDGGETIAFVHGKRGVSGTTQHVEFVDPDTGSTTADPATDEFDPWNTVVDQDRLLVLRTNNIAVVAEDESMLTGVEGGQDLALTTSHEGRGLLATASFTRVRLHPASALDDASVTDRFDLHHRYLTGQLRATDLDADGSDELVAYRYDWPGYDEVSANRGGGLLLLPFLVPSALVVFDLG